MPTTAPRTAATLLAMLFAAQAAAQTPAAPPPIDPDALRCYDLRHSDPAAAIALADRRLRGGGLRAADELVFETCRTISHAVAGDAEAARAGVAAIERLLASEPMPPGYALRAWSNAGAALQITGDLGRALQAHGRALKAAEAEDARAAQVVTLVNIALLHGEELAAYEEAESLFARAAELDAGQDPPNAMLRYNRGLNFLRMRRDAEARAQFEAALAIAGARDEQVLVRRTRTELAALDGGPRARATIESLLQAQQRGGDVSAAARSATLQARLSLAVGEPAAALRDADRALALLPATGFNAERRDALHLRTAAFVAAGRWREAHESGTRMHIDELKRLRAGELQDIAVLQATLEDERGREELARMRQQGELDALRVSHERRQRNLAVAALCLLVLLALGFFAYQRRITRRLRRLSTRDSLTGLLNRHAAGARLAGMVPARVDAGDARAVVFVVDIDRFKAINDHRGHDAGDAALVAVAKALLAACPADAVVARWGGEEFLVGCRDLDLRRAGDLAERLRRAASAASGGVDGLTVSIGFAAAPVFPPANAATTGADGGHWPDAVILADRALYAAKGGGRDTWVGLWGRAGARRAIDAALDDPGTAIAAGDLLLAAARPDFAWPSAGGRADADAR